MPLCFFLLYPPRPVEQPLGHIYWRRLSLPVIALLAWTLGMMAIRHMSGGPL